MSLQTICETGPPRTVGANRTQPVPSGREPAQRRHSQSQTTRNRPCTPAGVVQESGATPKHSRSALRAQYDAHVNLLGYSLTLHFTPSCRNQGLSMPSKGNSCDRDGVCPVARLISRIHIRAGRDRLRENSGFRGTALTTTRVERTTLFSLTALATEGFLRPVQPCR